MKRYEKETREQETKEHSKEPSYKEPAPLPAAVPPAPQGMPDLDKLPKEVKERLEKIKGRLEEFQKEVVKKFDKYIMGMTLLPPPKEGDKDKIGVLVLIDDTDSQKMSKLELKDKLTAIIIKTAEDIDKAIKPQIVILSELWQSCYDGKSEHLQTIALSAPFYDTGMLAAIKISELHKEMILKKFEKYIVAYVLAGSLVQGKATKESDIDVYVVIDDTDVKKMTRAELKDKLRAIIIGMGVEAGEMTGIRNKLNIQVYILTDFWDSIKEANPIIFTFLRDGVPFYDRGIFMPWKQLLRMGKIKPSMEAIDMYMSSGEQMLQRVQFKLKDMGMEDIYYALLTPSQAALMMYGVPPPTPKETPDVMRDIFVKKEKLLEDKFVDTIEKVIRTRKDLEHGVKKDITGKEIDELLDGADKYLKRIKRLFTQIEKMREEESVLHVYESAVTAIRDALRLEGVEKVKNEDIVAAFEAEMVHSGKIPERFLRMLEDVVKAKKDYDAGKLSKAEVDKVKRDSSQFIRFMVEHLQRKRGRELERTKIRVKHGERYGEVILLDQVAFIVHDIDKPEKEVSKAVIKADGSLGTPEPTTMEELEQHLAKIEIPAKVFIKQPIFEQLKGIFGKDVEVLVNY
jgi:uncharacterized protein (UPF0332 family)/predicted nucleotidyltransferase